MIGAGRQVLSEWYCEVRDLTGRLAASLPSEVPAACRNLFPPGARWAGSGVPLPADTR